MDKMKKKVRAHGKDNPAVVFVFYSGHGITMNGFLRIVMPHMPEIDYVNIDKFCFECMKYKNV
jgi:hypothetical protein